MARVYLDYTDGAYSFRACTCSSLSTKCSHCVEVPDEQYGYWLGLRDSIDFSSKILQTQLRQADDDTILSKEV